VAATTPPYARIAACEVPYGHPWGTSMIGFVYFRRS
jgi:hypothetical protein